MRRVRTASGATAVQIAEFVRGQQRIVEHVGSAHTQAELGVLLERARLLLADPAQGVLDLGVEPIPPAVGLVPRPVIPACSIPPPRRPLPSAARGGFSARTHGSCSRPWPRFSRIWGSTAWAMRCSGTW